MLLRIWEIYRLSQRCCWNFQVFPMCRALSLYIFPDVSKVPSAFTHFLDVECDSTIAIWSVGKCKPSDRAVHSRILECSNKVWIRLTHLGFCDRASWANCEVREKTNKIQQLDVYYQHFLIINTFSTCFGHHYAHLQETKTCVTARGVLRWYCWMWLVAVVGRCVVGCEHCEGYCNR